MHSFVQQIKNRIAVLETELWSFPYDMTVKAKIKELTEQVAIFEATPIAFDNKITVSFGSNFINDVDKTLDNLKKRALVLTVEKMAGVDSVNYVIEFKNAEAAFLFGKSRPQLKGL